MSMETMEWMPISPEASELGIIAWQYKKVGKMVWDSCGEFTYNKFKDDSEYNVRRLVVFDED